jgi:hypothetical protein
VDHRRRTEPRTHFYIHLSSTARYGNGGGSMMDLTTMHTGMMLTMVIYHLAIFIFAVLGIAASIKYLRC